jgi:2-polyprenyl-6-methoxyphenol hydroxylase-like FAD-dependent oxidoreductase
LDARVMADFDVLIVGGGPVGAALALALRGSGLAVGRIEARVAHAAADARPIALSYGSRLLLERLGVWEKLADATPIRRIHVSQRGGFGRVGLDAREARLPALGYVVDYSALTEAFGRALEAGDDAHYIQATVSALESGKEAVLVRFAAGGVTPDASARLLAVADGGALPVARMRVHAPSRIRTLPTSALPRKAHWRCCRPARPSPWCGRPALRTPANCARCPKLVSWSVCRRPSGIAWAASRRRAAGRGIPSS